MYTSIQGLLRVEESVLQQQYYEYSKEREKKVLFASSIFLCTLEESCKKTRL